MSGNYAFIDNENVNISVQKQGRKIDRGKLADWLRDELGVVRIYMFVGYVKKYESMYAFFSSLGYTLIFKPVNTNPRIPTKGNVDAELVLQAMIDIAAYDKAIIISGDGDFSCLVRYLREQDKLERLVVPNEKRYADLLNEAVGTQKIYSLSYLKDVLTYVPGEHEPETISDRGYEESYDDKFYA